ncbi:serine/threonine protein kinase [Phycicoccus sp. BSK3Z-2]|uniref:non-specific serine/threonine protein kinase n=1 Tax=Phycicoccus avicenniae TaxID=2828860 RepID=A0A941D9K6_9MICO|nr:serine/threonine-protein kinase [Phycicoccus avicenniae]MBR7744463.1 serine/threonine protein kinase [Phycicoccus avicenniae]
MSATTPTPQVPGFELGSVLGRGATSEVWEAARVADGRRVAVKVCAADAEVAAAAVREATVSARVAAEHLLVVEACVPLQDGRTALVMPLQRGGSLARLVGARGHLTPGEVVTVLAPVAATLGRLHAAGVVHGDVSPGNVLLDLDGRPVLADLGLGRALGEAPTAVWGTEGHLAPEVLLGGDVSAASDVYALGALGWLCLSGAVPGAPGLRRPLAETVRGGPEVAGLLALVESAVVGSAADRPDADAFAAALFDAAPAQPLHLVDGDDEVTSVTYRLRAAAGERPSGTGEPEGVPRRRGRRPLPRPSRPVLPGLPRLPALWVAARARGRLAAVTLAAAAVLGLGSAGWAAVVGEGTGTRGPATVVGEDPGTSRTASPGPGPATAPDPAMVPDAPSTDPTGLLRHLAAARARAWTTGDAAALDAALAPGPLRQRDEDGLRSLAEAGTRLEGLSYSVAGVRVVSAGEDRAVLRARLGTSGYTVVGSTDEETVRRTEAVVADVVVDLVRTGDGWRVVEVRDEE